ncbi:unnamed protein product [Amoebophrya sp. A120]|nr:unnamed protein product [Amoebophrya sp. A120]|eukprot:GSA120T00000527001.1
MSLPATRPRFGFAHARRDFPAAATTGAPPLQGKNVVAAPTAQSDDFSTSSITTATTVLPSKNILGQPQETAAAKVRKLLGDEVEDDAAVLDLNSIRTQLSAGSAGEASVAKTTGSSKNTTAATPGGAAVSCSLAGIKNVQQELSKKNTPTRRQTNFSPIFTPPGINKQNKQQLKNASPSRGDTEPKVVRSTSPGQVGTGGGAGKVVQVAPHDQQSEHQRKLLHKINNEDPPTKNSTTIVPAPPKFGFAHAYRGQQQATTKKSTSTPPPLTRNKAFISPGTRNNFNAATSGAGGSSAGIASTSSGAGHCTTAASMTNKNTTSALDDHTSARSPQMNIKGTADQREHFQMHRTNWDRNYNTPDASSSGGHYVARPYEMNNNSALFNSAGRTSPTTSGATTVPAPGTNYCSYVHNQAELQLLHDSERHPHRPQGRRNTSTRAPPDHEHRAPYDMDNRTPQLYSAGARQFLDNDLHVEEESVISCTSRSTSRAPSNASSVVRRSRAVNSIGTGVDVNNYPVLHQGGYYDGTTAPEYSDGYASPNHAPRSSQRGGKMSHHQIRYSNGMQPPPRMVRRVVNPGGVVEHQLQQRVIVKKKRGVNGPGAGRESGHNYQGSKARRQKGLQASQEAVGATRARRLVQFLFLLLILGLVVDPTFFGLFPSNEEPPGASRNLNVASGPEGVVWKNKKKKRKRGPAAPAANAKVGPQGEGDSSSVLAEDGAGEENLQGAAAAASRQRSSRASAGRTGKKSSRRKKRSSKSKRSAAAQPPPATAAVEEHATPNAFSALEMPPVAVSTHQSHEHAYNVRDDDIDDFHSTEDDDQEELPRPTWRFRGSHAAAAEIKRKSASSGTSGKINNIVPTAIKKSSKFQQFSSWLQTKMRMTSTSLISSAYTNHAKSNDQPGKKIISNRVIARDLDAPAPSRHAAFARTYVGVGLAKTYRYFVGTYPTATRVFHLYLAIIFATLTAITGLLVNLVYMQGFVIDSHRLVSATAVQRVLDHSSSGATGEDKEEGAEDGLEVEKMKKKVGFANANASTTTSPVLSPAGKKISALFTWWNSFFQTSLFTRKELYEEEELSSSCSEDDDEAATSSDTGGEEGSEHDIIGTTVSRNHHVEHSYKNPRRGRERSGVQDQHGSHVQILDETSHLYTAIRKYNPNVNYKGSSSGGGKNYSNKLQKKNHAAQKMNSNSTNDKFLYYDSLNDCGGDNYRIFSLMPQTKATTVEDVVKMSGSNTRSSRMKTDTEVSAGPRADLHARSVLHDEEDDEEVEFEAPPVETASVSSRNYGTNKRGRNNSSSSRASFQQRLQEANQRRTQAMYESSVKMSQWVVQKQNSPQRQAAPQYLSQQQLSTASIGGGTTTSRNNYLRFPSSTDERASSTSLIRDQLPEVSLDVSARLRGSTTSTPGVQQIIKPVLPLTTDDLNIKDHPEYENQNHLLYRRPHENIKIVAPWNRTTVMNVAPSSSKELTASEAEGRSSKEPALSEASQGSSSTTVMRSSEEPASSFTSAAEDLA